MSNRNLPPGTTPDMEDRASGVCLRCHAEFAEDGSDFCYHCDREIAARDNDYLRDEAPIVPEAA